MAVPKTILVAVALSGCASTTNFQKEDITQNRIEMCEIYDKAINITEINTKNDCSGRGNIQDCVRSSERLNDLYLLYNKLGCGTSA
jgi:hypothetical protein